MSNQKIRDLLEQLQGELERMGPLDEKGRGLLESITEDINSLLKDSSTEADDSLLERFQDTIDHFKIEHPQLTMALSEMMAILSNAGI